MNGALYFAFGSNMNLGQMRRRCPSARLLGPATLADYRLAFVGSSRLWAGGAVATLVHAPGVLAAGLLYVLSPADLAALDGFEGHPHHYRRRRMRVTDADGLSVRAHTYFLDDRPGVPAPAYFWRIADAYHEYGFDISALTRALPQEAP